jgi:transcriptional regulator with XRE-family HTH domain
MSAQQFREALTRLRLSQADAAKLLRRSGTTVNRYALGKLPIPGTVELCLALLEAEKHQKEHA